MFNPIEVFEEMRNSLPPEADEFVTVHATAGRQRGAHEERYSPVQWHLAHGDNLVELVPTALVVWHTLEDLLQPLHGRFRRDRCRWLAIREVESVGWGKRRQI